MNAPWPIFDLVSLAGGHSDNGVVGVFVCYLDDSDAQLSRIVTLAGYVARLEAWRKFEEEVASVFHMQNVCVLHAKELHDTDGYFAGWSRLRKRSFITDLYAIAERHISFGISVSARKGAIKRLRRQNPKRSGQSAYGFCFSSILHFVTRNNPLRDEIQREGISFIVESGHKNNAEIEKEFHRQKRSPSCAGITHSITFADKQSCRAIQLADFFAFHSRRYESMSERFDGKLLLPGHELYKIAQEQVPYRSVVFGGNIEKIEMAEDWNPPLPMNAFETWRR